MIASVIRDIFRRSMGRFLGSARDLVPIIVTVGIFQLLVFQQALSNGWAIAGGMIMVAAGLALFIAGLEMGLFPLGEQMAQDFARKGSLPWLVTFAFFLGFGTTFAEPALFKVAGEAAQLVVSPQSITGNQADDATAALVASQNRFALTLRTVVALSVGCALVLGVFRIVRGWPLHYVISIGYCAVMACTTIAPAHIIGIAYDAGGVTTSTITVPLTAALGVGLASSIQGRNPMLDGFGLIALAALAPIIFVLLLGTFWG